MKRRRSRSNRLSVNTLSNSKRYNVSTRSKCNPSSGNTRSKRKRSSVRTAAEEGAADTSKHRMSKHHTAGVVDTSKHRTEVATVITRELDRHAFAPKYDTAVNLC